ncbi:MAG TPA: hypothetical protein VMW91_03470, partial [Desulfosporosinus sp.]|nr:hypothetical protein [Desulfosporosinus sp.]
MKTIIADYLILLSPLVLGFLALANSPVKIMLASHTPVDASFTARFKIFAFCVFIPAIIKS